MIVAFLKALHRLIGSARFAVVLLVLFALAMLGGTMLEVFSGVAKARSHVFLSWWFAGLMDLITISLLVSLFDRLPFKKRLAGFYVVHISLIMVFIGAMVSSLRGVTGVMLLRPGQEQNVVHVDGLIKPLVLPFALELERFEIEYEPHSKRESGYRSRVKIKPQGFAHEIEMNRPLDLAGFSFYQTSHFKTADGSFGSLLSVNKDPGRALKYSGCFLFVVGFLIHIRVRGKGAEA